MADTLPHGMDFVVRPDGGFCSRRVLAHLADRRRILSPAKASTAERVHSRRSGASKTTSSVDPVANRGTHTLSSQDACAGYLTFGTI